MKHRIILLAIAALAAFEAAAARPRLVVNIVVGSMRAEDLGPYGARFPTGTSDITQVHLYVHYMNAPSV